MHVLSECNNNNNTTAVRGGVVQVRPPACSTPTPPGFAPALLPCYPRSNGDRLAFAELRVGNTAITSSSPSAALVANPLCWRLDGYGAIGVVYDYACSSGTLTGRYVTVQNFSPWTVVYPPWNPSSAGSLMLNLAEVMVYG